jgi:hypothetical protein
MIRTWVKHVHQLECFWMNSSMDNQTADNELEPKTNTTAEIPKHLQKPRLRRWEASEYMVLAHGLTIAPATLAKLASIGGGPGFHRVGRIPLYPRDELDRWATEKLGRMVRSTSDTTQ